MSNPVPNSKCRKCLIIHITYWKLLSLQAVLKRYVFCWVKDFTNMFALHSRDANVLFSVHLYDICCLLYKDTLLITNLVLVQCSAGPWRHICAKSFAVHTFESFDQNSKQDLTTFIWRNFYNLLSSGNLNSVNCKNFVKWSHKKKSINNNSVTILK